MKAGALGVAIGPASAEALAQTARAELDSYQPIFFAAAEWAFILAACARLIPSEGEGPGALEAHVPIFLDRDLAGPYGRGDDWHMGGPHDPNAPEALGYQSPLTPAQLFRASIAEVDAMCARAFGSPFAGLDAARQDATLKFLEAGKPGLRPELRDFFSMLWRTVREGYFSDPRHGGNRGMMAWRHIGFPGARGAFREWADQHDREYPLGPVSIAGERS
jgi:gluconate 2-dehydrogenase gamma chain